MQRKIIQLIIYLILLNDSLGLFEERESNFKFKLVNVEKETNKLINLGHNEIKIEDKTKYILDFSNIIKNLTQGDLLIFTNLYDIQDIISQFDLFTVDKHQKNVTFNSNIEKAGFIDVEFVKRGEYNINKNTTREEFYDRTIMMRKGNEEKQFYINFIPNDNNSDLYFFQTNKSSVRDDNKDRLKLYYSNDFENKNLDEIIKGINDNPMKRERCINGKIEIFGYSYKYLDKDIGISIGYKQIKGTGILGPIICLSVLFIALVIIVAIFIKNTYFTIKRRAEED